MIKPAKHAVSVWAGGRQRKLYRLKPGGTFYVRFQLRGKDIKRSTGATTEAAARNRAKDMVEAEMQRLSTSCTWRELCDRVSVLEKMVGQQGGAK
jgi:hypothetical protein